MPVEYADVKQRVVSMASKAAKLKRRDRDEVGPVRAGLRGRARV
jgi:hypothetical protein